MEDKNYQELIGRIEALEEQLAQQEQKLCINVKDAARLCGCSERLMRDMVNIKGFPKIIHGRRVIIPKKAFISWLETYAMEGGFKRW